MKKIVLMLSLLLVYSVSAKTFVVTVKCHVPTGFTVKHVKVEVDLNNGYPSDAKEWAKDNGERLCKQYAPSGYWFDGVYNVQYK